MIKLPDNWQDMVQLRDWTSPINTFGEVVVLVFALKNKDGQVWIYQENNQEYPLKGSSFKGLDTFPTSSSIKSASANEKKAVLKQMYDRMLYHLPAIAVLQDKVIRYKDGEHYEDITNDEWEMLPLEGLKPYIP